jgi:S1-C subfamily serine protease
MSEQPGHGTPGAPGTPDGSSGDGYSVLPPGSSGDGESVIPDGSPGDGYSVLPTGSSGHGYSMLPPRPRAGDGVGDGATGVRDGVSDLGKFDWFAELDSFGRGEPQGGPDAAGPPANAAAASERGSDEPKRRPWRRRVSSQWGEKQRDFGRRGDERDDHWLADRRKERGVGRLLRGWRLALTAVGLAIACTLAGGVLGGFVAVHTEGGALSDPTYSVGSVPPALTNRPASSVAGIAARDTPAVVMIKVNGGEGTGSGFLIRGGYIVTDNHVVTLDGILSSAALRVYFSDGKSAPGVLVGRDPYSDIAVIKAVGASNLPTLTLGNSDGVAVGDPVIAIGSPLGLADTVTSGIVSAVDRPVQPTATVGNATPAFFDAIQTDAPINPGNSGGPLVNARGQVIGLNAAIDTLGSDPITGTQGGSIGLGFAIPMDLARRVVEQLITTGRATHSVMDASINENFAGNGAQIMTGRRSVQPGGPAARAGLLPGDVIIKVGSLPISNAYGLMDAIRSLAPGSRISLTFVRQGETHQTELTLGSASS